MQKLWKQQVGKGDSWLDLDDGGGDDVAVKGVESRSHFSSRRDAQVMYAQHRMCKSGK